MWSKALLLATTLVVVAIGQDVPSECKELPPREVQIKCCTQPRLWRPELFPMCDVTKPCAGDCFSKESKMLKSDNKLDFEASRAFTTEGLAKIGASPIWTDIMMKSITACSNVENEEDKANPNKCQTFSDSYFMCIQRYKLHNCPADSWNNSDPECTALKDKVAKCRKP